MRMIKAIVAVPEVGEVYTGKVRSIMPYGAFVEFLPGKTDCCTSLKSTGNASKQSKRPD